MGTAVKEKLRQFTGTVYIIEDGQALLIYHRKMQKWLPPGGHLDPHELPHEGAVREALEETGLEVELVHQENILVDEPNAVSIPRPYLCLLEEIPPHGDHPPHQHIDMVYVGRPAGGQLRHNERETAEIRWFTWEEIASLDENTLFNDTRDILEHLLER